MKSRRLATGLLAVATAVSVSACGSGRDAMTYQKRNNAESTSTSAGDLQLRNISARAPRSARGYDVGDDVRIVLTVTNAGDDEDRLVEVTSSAAEEVAVLILGDEDRDMVVPPRGSTGEAAVLELRGLTRPLRPGEYVDLTLRFADNGSTEVLVPIRTTGESDRAVYTGERAEGGEEPALQAPAGGHHGSDEEEAEAEAG